MTVILDSLVNSHPKIMILEVLTYCTFCYTLQNRYQSFCLRFSLHHSKTPKFVNIAIEFYQQLYGHFARNEGSINFG